MSYTSEYFQYKKMKLTKINTLLKVNDDTMT